MVIPEIEQQKEWFFLFKHLIEACKKNPNYKKSKYDNASWQITKGLIEAALNNVINAKMIFSRGSQIKTEDDPDSVIDDIFAELRCIPYLLSKGFKNIKYNKKNNVDFIAEFDEKKWGIEVSFIRGPSFKTQEIVLVDQLTGKSVFKLNEKMLINRLKSKYQEKEKQILKHGFNQTNTIIFLITNLEETYEPWLGHVSVAEKHPIWFFVMSAKIFTVVFGQGTVYEPDHELFSKLDSFKFENFHKLISDSKHL